MAGEVALDQLLGRGAARGAGVEAAEEDLDQWPRDLGRERALVRLVEAADVERARVAQRRRADAGGEGIVDVDEVEVDAAEQAFEGAADVDRDRAGAGTRAAGQGDAGTEGEHRDPGDRPVGGGVEDRGGAGAGGGERPARLAHRRPRLRGRCDQHPVAASGELGRGPGDELVHLVADPPWVRGHLDHREALARGHAVRICPRE